MKNIFNLTLYSTVLALFLCIFPFDKACADDLTDENKSYRFGVISLAHPIVLYRQYIPFFDYINEHLPWSFELVLYKEYKDVVLAISEGDIDLALFAGNTFIQAQNHTNLTPIVAVCSSNKTTKNYSIFVAKDDNTSINSLQDLRGKSIAFGSLQSTSSYLMPVKYLAENGITLHDFSGYANLSNHDAVARAVLRGKYAVGVMGESFAQRFLEQGLKQIATTHAFPGFILVARSGVSKTVSIALQNLLLNIDPTSEIFQKKSIHWPEILQHGFAPVVLDDYNVFKKQPLLHK